MALENETQQPHVNAGAAVRCLGVDAAQPANYDASVANTGSAAYCSNRARNSRRKPTSRTRRPSSSWLRRGSGSRRFTRSRGTRFRTQPNGRRRSQARQGLRQHCRKRPSKGRIPLDRTIGTPLFSAADAFLARYALAILTLLDGANYTNSIIVPVES